MSLLTIIQYVCGRSNVPVPAAVFANIGDTQLLQMVRLLEEEGRDLSMRGAWQGLTFEATHTTTAAEDQGTVVSIATNGFRAIKNGTFWDRSANLQILGPLTDEEWQRIKAMSTSGPRYYYRIRGGKLLITPEPAASLSWAFEYLSKNWILDNDGSTYKQYFTEDTDTLLIPEELAIQGLRWRWLRAKGLDYAEEFETYEAQVKQALGEDGGKPRLCMDGGPRNAQPGVFVPQGSWLQ